MYNPPSANAKKALGELLRATGELQTAHPDSFLVIAGDFNHTTLI